MRVRHRLVLWSSSLSAVLMSAGGLPEIDTEDRHTAEVDYLLAAVRERFALDAVVLRSIDYREDPDRRMDVRTHELWAPHDAPVVGARWVALDDPTAWPDAADLALASNLRDFHERGDRRAWMRPEWWEEICAWIVARLGRRDRAAVEVTQLRTWFSSCVLRVRDAEGQVFYCKSVLPRALEARLTGYLADHVGGVAAVAAIDEERGRILLHGCPGVNLEQTIDAAAWDAGVRTYARMQVACAPLRQALVGLGCALRSLESVADGIERLLADAGALLMDEAEGLTAAEVGRLRRRDWRGECRALAAYDLPLTLDHGDLWPGNVFVDGADCAVIDWEDACVSHPFLSLGPLLMGLRVYHPSADLSAHRARLRAAYLEAWAPFAPQARLRDAFDLAQGIAMADLAARYRGQPPSVVKLHPWMRTNVPQLLKLALD